LEFLSLAASSLEWDREGWHKVGSRSQGTNFADLALLARLPHLRHLYLAETGAVSLSPVSELVELRTLDVFNTQVADLGPVCRLAELQSLDVSNTQVVDLSPLSGLVRLQTLDISDTQVVDLSPLSTLVGLQKLNISGTQVADLGPLSGLAGLQKLNISRTQITDLTALSGLMGLEELNVSRTQAVDLSPLSKLAALKRLDVSNSRVADLAPLVALMHRSLQVRWSLVAYLTGDGVYVANCPLTNPPPELVAQGNIAILNYFAERAQGGVDHLYEAKMLIVGEGGAGKTSLLRRLYSPDDPLPTESDSTKGIKIYRHEFKLKNGRTFRLNVWDFGGQQIYHATHQFFLTQRSLYVLVDDTRKDYKSVSDEGFKYWLELIEVFGGRSPTLIFQNEKSGRSKAIDLTGIKQRYDNVKELYTGNLERRDAADGIRDGIEFFASHLSHIGEELPARWLKVREEIERLAVEQAYIPAEKYYELYGKHIEFDEAKALLLSRYYHDLGVFLHFQDDMLLKRTVILQNEWATEAVFRILEDEEVKRKRRRFGKEDYERIWKDSAYARMHLELLALMKNFELCYELRDSDPAKWLAPQLLSPTKPDAVGNWAKAEDLVLRYNYAFLPKGMISRLTVRLHRFVKDPEKAWRTGVLFEYGRSSVLAEILLSGNEIELRARGPEHKALLSVIAADLDALNESFRGLREKVGKLVPCHCKVCAKEATPSFFMERDLLRRKEHGRVKVECGRSYEEVDVVALLDGIRMGEAPAFAREDVRTIRIFLASSAELEKDRDEFDSYFRRQNDLLINKGIYLEIVRWEYFIGAMSKTRLQDEYNKTIRECDIIVCLFFTKAGRFTEEEFDVAFSKFKDTGSPRIFTFFKKASVDIDTLSVKNLQSLEAFQKKLNDLGHFYTRYEDSQDLKLQFRDQLDSLIEKSGL
jgi:Leucine-rich repeat (LRR) protein